MATGFTDNIWNNVLKDIDWKLTQLGAPLTFDGYETKRVETVDPGVWHYFADFVVSFGQRVAKPGASVFVNRLWANEVLIYDRTAGFAAPAVVPTATPPSFPPTRTVIEPPASAPPSPVPGDAPGLRGLPSTVTASRRLLPSLSTRKLTTLIITSGVHCTTSTRLQR
jgi:hypothetical protein